MRFFGRFGCPRPPRLADSDSPSKMLHFGAIDVQVRTHVGTVLGGIAFFGYPYRFSVFFAIFADL